MTSTNYQLSKDFIGAVKDEWQLFSNCSTDYTHGAPIGFGASSTVYAAYYRPSSDPPIPCALKVLDLDSLPPHSLSLLHRETQLMSLSKHPNVIRVRGTWMDGHKLYIAMRLMNKGSAADVMRYGWSSGMEEEVVRCILKQALEGLNYLHMNELIHRDIKAANLLIDDDGTVLLGDLGVAASLVDDHDHHKAASPRRINFDAATTPHPARPSNIIRPKIGKRKSFVGTPCWMAPELIQGKQYDSSADIWSFGITALELSQGRPPRSRESPHNVLLQTVQSAPPTLDREGGQYKYSRAFKEIVESCLAKDPTKRPTAAELLQTPFFRSAKRKSYLVGAILKGLPPLTQRQERRKRQSSLLNHRTLDSWDFSLTASATASSLTPSAYLRKAGPVGKSAETTLGPEAVFDFEPEVDESVVIPIEDVHLAKDDESQVARLEPPFPEEASPSSSQFSSSPSSLLSSSLDRTSISDAAPIAAKNVVPSVPIPVLASTDLSVAINVLPSSNPDATILSSFSRSMGPPSVPVHPSTSAPSNLVPLSTSPSFWRRLTGISKSEEENRGRKNFLSRKASDVLLRTKSKTS